jgi:uncharacterized membrane protein
MKRGSASALFLMLCACHSGAGDTEGQAGVPGDTTDTRPYMGIAEHETLRFTGTEPFWSGKVAGGVLTYATPEQPDGDTIAVQRFAGRNGVSYSGTWDGKTFTLAATPGECSDGMSDRRYPFAVTVILGEETRHGCGWTGNKPFAEPQQP